MIISLGIESSCDDSAVAIVDENRQILAHEVSSQIEQHRQYGGVMPEVASRAHINILPHLIYLTLEKSGLRLQDLSLISVTAGPGLIGGVLVGVMIAKGIAAAAKKPIIAVNHLEGHALTVRLTHDVTFPFLLLLVSGGHCQILSVLGVGKYELIGKTLDDAVGEVFDKVARMLNLGYPGGPQIERMAKNGDPKRFSFPMTFSTDKSHCNMSFSGLKTAVSRVIQSISNLSAQDVCDICASFQYTVAKILCDRVLQSIIRYEAIAGSTKRKTFVISGGVAANQYIRAKLLEALPEGYELIAPPIELCTDNGAMIAWAGLERFRLGASDSLNFEPKSRWSLGQAVLLT